MGGFAARKCLRVLDHVENGTLRTLRHKTFPRSVLAMELLAATQGMEFLKPLKTTAPLQRIYELVRKVVPYVCGCEQVLRHQQALRT